MEQTKAVKNESLHVRMGNEFWFMREPLAWLIFRGQRQRPILPKERCGKLKYSTKYLCQRRMLKFQPAFQKAIADNDILWHYLAVTQLPMHKNAFIRLLKQCFGLFGTALITVSVYPAVLLDDHWADGSRSEQNLPQKSAWFASTGAALVAATNSLTLSLGSSAVLGMTYFTSNSTLPVQLEVGQILTASLLVSFGSLSAANTSQGFRLALCNFADSTLSPKRVSADGFSSASQGNGVQGYALFQNVGTGFNDSTPMSLYKRTTLTDASLLGTSSDWTLLGNGPGDTNSFSGFAESNLYHLRFAVQRTDADSTSINVSWSNALSGATLAMSAIDNSATNFSFDGLALRPQNAASSAGSIILRGVSVELSSETNQVGTLGTPLHVELSGDLIIFTFSGTANTQYELQRSTNLFSWAPRLITNSFSAAPIQLVDHFLDPADQPRHAFYRLSIRPDVPQPTNGAIGFATVNGNTVGGQGGPTVTVSNAAGLSSAIGAVGPRIIRVEGTISVSGNVIPKSNLTIIGHGTNAALVGNLNINAVSNVIVQNLHISNPAGVGDGDGVTVENSHHVWIDHCTFSDCYDGQLDITHGSDYVTVSSCKFAYSTNSGHNFSGLVGHSDNNAVQDAGKLHVSYHHNWWTTLCMERMPRIRFGRVHSFNNYFNCVGNNYCIRASIDSEALIENNYFENVDTPYEKFAPEGLIRALGNDTTTATGVQSFNDPVFSPPYAYSLESPAIAKTNVINGAGAGVVPFP